MDKFSDQILPQATRAFDFIQHQLRELTDYCKLQDGPVSPGWFLELENSLLKILHEIRAACNPPPKKPVKSDFDIIRSIASGAFGTEYQVRHKQTGQDFAMKQIKLVEDERHYMLMEHDILIFLEHPLVISMSCSFETESHLYMTMEYVGGGDRKSLLKKHGRFSVEASRFYIAELVLVLEYIQSFGVIHRDLKPDNLLISATGHLKVADFGISKVGSVNLAPCLSEEDCERVAREFTDEECCGTPLFMAPEVLQYEGYGKPTDRWSTGIILFNVLTGSMPFSDGVVTWTNGLDEYMDTLISVSEPDQDGVVGVQPELPADRADFTHVAFRFSKEYGSPMPLSPIKPMTRFPSLEKPGHSEAKEEQDPDGWHESAEEVQVTDGCS